MRKLIAVFVICCVMAAFADNPHITSLAQLIDVAVLSPANGDTLTFDASIGKWTNKTATSSDAAKIVKRFDVTNQSAPINGVLFTAPETGIYRVNAAVRLLNAPQDFRTTVEITSADENGPEFGGVATNSTNYSYSVPPIFRIPAGNSIAVSFDNGGFSYNLVIIVEKL